MNFDKKADQLIARVEKETREFKSLRDRVRGQRLCTRNAETYYVLKLDRLVKRLKECYDIEEGDTLEEFVKAEREFN